MDLERGSQFQGTQPIVRGRHEGRRKAELGLGPAHSLIEPGSGQGWVMPPPLTRFLLKGPTISQKEQYNLGTQGPNREPIGNI